MAGQPGNGPVRIDPAKVIGTRIPFRARLGGLAAGTVLPFVTPKLNLAFQQAPDTGLRAPRAREPAAPARGLLRAVEVPQAPSATPAAKALAYRVFRRLPVKPGLAVFESHMGSSTPTARGTSTRPR